MNHDDHVALLRPGIHAPGGHWADFGSGSGAFTLALADLLSSNATIYSVDRDQHALMQQKRMVERVHPHLKVHYLLQDFTVAFDLPALDGIIIANALHYVKYKNQEKIVQLIRSYLKPGGRLIIVAYDTDKGNRWVPYPLSFPSWLKLAGKAGFEHTEQLATRPSSFLGRFYSAASW